MIEADIVDNFIFFRRSKKILTSSFDNYHFKRLELALYSFYDGQKTIIIVESTPKIEKDIGFSHDHLIQKKNFNSF